MKITHSKDPSGTLHNLNTIPTMIKIGPTGIIFHEAKRALVQIKISYPDGMSWGFSRNTAFQYRLFPNELQGPI